MFVSGSVERPRAEIEINIDLPRLGVAPCPFFLWGTGTNQNNNKKIIKNNQDTKEHTKTQKRYKKKAKPKNTLNLLISR